MEIIIDEVTYDNEVLSPVLQVWLPRFFCILAIEILLLILNDGLQVLDHPSWKLELVLQYFTKYTAKVRFELRKLTFTGFLHQPQCKWKLSFTMQPAVRTRRASDSKEDATFCGTLRSLTNVNSAKSIVKKIGAEAVQLLLAHGFEVLNSAACCIILLLGSVWLVTKRGVIFTS